jgi:hypothetical protein
MIPRDKLQNRRAKKKKVSLNYQWIDGQVETEKFRKAIDEHEKWLESYN